jgi:hypothetical protein
MCKWRKIFKNLVMAIILFICADVFAQEEGLIRAQQLYRSRNIDQAILAIDSVVVNPASSGDYTSWSTRAYIYYELYRRTDKHKLNSSLRDTILASVYRSVQLNPDSLFKEQNRKMLVTLAAGYFNIAKLLLEDSVNYERSVIAYSKYRDIFSQAEPDNNFNQKDIDYYLAVGSTFSEIFIKDNNNTDAQDHAKVALMKVLEIQDDNPNANVNMGLMYYNQAVNLSKTLDYGADFSTIDIVQENMVKLAKQSEQFIVKVYQKDQKNAKAVEALYYIYRMLNENAKSDEFKVKCKELGINVEQTSK